MPIEFHCEFCSRLLRVPDGSQGKQCQCPGCGKLLKIPLHTTADTSQANTNLPAISICIPCPKCRHELICDPSLIGTKGQCRSCKHIFLITEDPNEAAKSEALPRWIFNCPKCDQLFEGNEGMRGKRGKCHVCGQVFQIEIKLADASNTTGPSVSSVAPATSVIGSIPSATSPTPARKVEPHSASKSKPEALPVAKAIATGPIQFKCTKCQGILEVPGNSGNQITFCPFCDEQLTVPSKSNVGDSKQTANRKVDIFDSIESSGPVDLGLDGLPPMMQPMQTSMPQRSVARRGGNKYLVCGIFTILFGVLGIITEIYQILMAALTAYKSQLPAESIAAGFVAVAIGFAFCLSIVQIFGGIAMIRRRGLGLARTAAIINCLPCVCINFPFGIWGAVLTFGASAQNDFR